MSALPARIDEGVEEVNALLAQFRQWEARVRGEDDPDQLAEMVTQAKLLKEAARIRKMAAEVGQAAFRLEAHALRRLFLLGARAQTQFGSWAAKNAAASFAATDDTEFERLLSEGWSSVVALGKHLDDQRHLRVERDDILGGGRRPNSSRGVWHLASELEMASKAILERITPTGDPFTVTKAAEELLHELGVDSSDLTRLAAREVVMESLRHWDSDVVTDGFPAFVTYVDGDTWLKVPIRCATAEQLRWMANYRKAQADNLLEASKELARAAHEVEQAAREAFIGPSAFMVRWLWDGVPPEWANR